MLIQDGSKGFLFVNVEFHAQKSRRAQPICVLLPSVSVNDHTVRCRCSKIMSPPNCNQTLSP